MSRLKNYASALGSSYVALAANIVYTLASVPLALRYLDNAQFALWGLSVQIAGYIALIDFGMAGISRILIDYKDRKDDLAYGSAIQTSVLVSAVQAVLIVVCGIALAVVLVPVLNVPATLERHFIVLVIGQSVWLACTFLTRIFNYLLVAHQRQDVMNYSQVLLFAGNFAVLWLCFSAELGILSILWAQFCGWVLATAVAVFWCDRLRVYPARGKWGKATWAKFSELFAFGRDIFLFVLGSQLINASQVILVTRQLGFEAAAVWLICTRSFTLVGQLVYRIFDTSCPALAEMIVRNEKGWLLHRFRSIVLLSSSVAVVAGAIFAICNQSFVHVWADSKAGWPMSNDVLLALWLIISASARCHVGLVGQLKDFGFLRYLYLFEGLSFVVLSIVFLKSHGIPAMLLAGISSTLLFSFPYGIWRTARYFELPWRRILWDWSWPALRLGLSMAVLASLTWWLVRPLGAGARFVVASAVLIASGIPSLFYLGVDEKLRQELRDRILGKWRK